MSEMGKTYNPQAIENKWYEFWENNGYFNADPNCESGNKETDCENFCIMIPPPNVTGRLHMGHAFQDTIMDSMVRYHRMKGHNTLWQAGTDHAGIATQMVVERLINAEGKTRHDYGREKFTEKIWEWKKESGNTITKQKNPATPSPNSCVAWAHHWTGHANVSPWTKACPPRSPKFLYGSTKKA